MTAPATSSPPRHLSPPRDIRPLDSQFPRAFVRWVPRPRSWRVLEGGDFDFAFFPDGWPARTPLGNFGCRSIREKALSRRKTPLPCFSHRVTARVVEDRSSGTLTVNPFSMKQIVPPAIDTAQTSAMILLSEPRF